MRETPMVGRASPQGLTTIRHHWGTGLRAQMRQDTFAYTDTLAHERLGNDVTHTSSPSRAGPLAGLGRAGWEHGALENAPLTRPDDRPWAREPGKKKKKIEERNILSSLCFRTFRRHYVPPELCGVIIRLLAGPSNTGCTHASLFPGLSPVVRAPLETYVFSAFVLSVHY